MYECVWIPTSTLAFRVLALKTFGQRHYLEMSLFHKPNIIKHINWQVISDTIIHLSWSYPMFFYCHPPFGVNHHIPLIMINQQGTSHKSLTYISTSYLAKPQLSFKKLYNQVLRNQNNVAWKEKNKEKKRLKTLEMISSSRAKCVWQCLQL